MSGPNPLRRFLGGLLMAVGGLLALLAGACTAIFGGASIIDVVNGHGWGLAGDAGGLAMLAAIFGGIPVAIGIGLFLLGRWLWGKRPG